MFTQLEIVDDGAGEAESVEAFVFKNTTHFQFDSFAIIGEDPRKIPETIGSYLEKLGLSKSDKKHARIILLASIDNSEVLKDNPENWFNVIPSPCLWSQPATRWLCLEQYFILHGCHIKHSPSLLPYFKVESDEDCSTLLSENFIINQDQIDYRVFSTKADGGLGTLISYAKLKTRFKILNDSCVTQRTRNKEVILSVPKVSEGVFVTVPAFIARLSPFLIVSTLLDTLNINPEQKISIRSFIVHFGRAIKLSLPKTIVKQYKAFQGFNIIFKLHNNGAYFISVKASPKLDEYLWIHFLKFGLDVWSNNIHLLAMNQRKLFQEKYKLEVVFSEVDPYIDFPCPILTPRTCFHHF